MQELFFFSLIKNSILCEDGSVCCCFDVRQYSTPLSAAILASPLLGLAQAGGYGRQGEEMKGVSGSPGYLLWAERLKSKSRQGGQSYVDLNRKSQTVHRSTCRHEGVNTGNIHTQKRIINF